MAIQKEYAAVDERFIKKESEVLRDTRSMTEIGWKALMGDTGFSVSLFVMAAIPVIEPSFSFISIPIATVFFLGRRTMRMKDRLPMRVPSVAKKMDYGDALPGRRGYSIGKGTFYMGVDRYGRELWLRASDILTHLIVFGTTGSGKTVTLTALASNYLAMGGGFIYTDPKAAPGLWRNIHMLVRMMGRDDDMRVANYMTANAPGNKEGPERLTNTVNPFAFGNADMLTQLLNSLIEVSGGDNAVFGQNAMMASASLMLCLVDLREKGHIELSISTIRDYFNTQKMIGLAVDERISQGARDSIGAFLGSMGWAADKPADNQPRAFGEQFQYAKAYYGLALNMLTDTYGHIYRHMAGEIDMQDIIRNRRILLNMLPSLEKSPGELKQLGRVNLSATRNAISIGLGDRIEGMVEDVTESLPLASPVPFGVVTDEYAAIPTPGFAEVMTQGRGLGISSLLGTQDYEGMKGDTDSDRRGAAQILENTKVKIGMKLTGAGDTWELWKGLAGEVYAMQTQGLSVGQSGQSGQKSPYDLSYEDQQSASVTKISPISIEDFQRQSEGEFHAFVNGEIVRGDMFFDPLFDNPKDELKQLKVLEYNLNVVRLMYVEPPDLQDLNVRRGNLKALLDNVVTACREEDWLPVGDINPAFAPIAKSFAAAKMNESRELIAISSFITWVNGESTGHSPIDELLNMQKEDMVIEAEPTMDIGRPAKEVVTANVKFAPALPFNNIDTEAQVSEPDNKEQEASPLSGMGKRLNWMDVDQEAGKDELVKDIAAVEEKLGETPEKANTAADLVAKELGSATQYPTTPIPEKATDDHLKSMINNFIDDI